MRSTIRIVAALAALLGLAAVAPAQVTCSLTSAAALPLKSGDKFAAKFTAAISPGWHISSLTQPDGGPVRTEITLAEKQPFKFAGPIIGPKPHVEHSDAFDSNVETYTGTVVFTIPLVATEDVPFDKLRARPLVVEITYQACNEETCLLPRTEKVSCIIDEAKQADGDGKGKSAGEKKP
jgi:thiol:disulfide interchange protein DsbD